MPLDILHRLLAPLREPPLSSRYPDAPPLVPAATRGLPAVDATRCARERACVAACPTGAIAVEEETWSVDAGRCVFCAACAPACPHAAIAMSLRVELAATERATLVEVVALPGRGGRP